MEILKIVGMIVGGIVAIFVVISVMLALFFLGMWPFKAWQCDTVGQQTGYEVQYRNLSLNCYLKINGRWIPYDAWIDNTGN